MAMLAEPRRKQKVINLRAKNNAWSNDSSKFGQRMLEKMGWTSGKGLGAHENGITEHVVARYKNDEKGLGFEDKNDQWTKHEDDFNALLANLSNASDNPENLHSGMSLEDKSKKSKARIHYHKFTRGKDISKYSEKDLANIFGKKSFKNVEEHDESLKEDLKTTEQIFTEKGSMEDYFKNKLSEFKSKSKLKVPIISENDPEYDEQSGYGFCGFSQQTDDMKCSTEMEYSQEIENNNVSTNTSVTASGTEILKKKKKKSKIHDECGMDENINENSNNADQQNEYKDQDVHVKIKKSKFKHEIRNPDNTEELLIQECSEIKIKKKKSKNKDKLENNYVDKKTGNEISEQTIGSTEEFVENKKSKKVKSSCVSPCTEINYVSETELNQTQVYKRKKNKCSKNELCEDNFELDDIKTKKKSKRKNDQSIVDVAQTNNDLEHIPKKKKKRKCKDN